jgi:hypothetical protein
MLVIVMVGALLASCTARPVTGHDNDNSRHVHQGALKPGSTNMYYSAHEVDLFCW